MTAPDLDKAVQAAAEAVARIDLRFGDEPWQEAVARVAIEVALASLSDGWQIVPKEPTEEMCEFAEDNFDRNGDPIEVCYRAFLLASPFREEALKLIPTRGE